MVKSACRDMHPLSSRQCGVLQASNLLQRALGELQQAETILQQDKHLAGEPAVHVIAPACVTRC